MSIDRVAGDGDGFGDGTADGAAEDLGEWHRLHPLSPLVVGGRALLVLVILALTRLVGRSGGLASLAVDTAIAVIALVVGVVSWLVTRWRVEGPDLRIETGLIRRSSQRYPLRQLQAIDVVRSGVARILGLAELRLRMAGGSNKGRLACLTDAHARALREQLLTLSAANRGPVGPTDLVRSAGPVGAAHRSDPAPAPGAASRRNAVAPVDACALETSGPPLLQVATGQLLASLLLTTPGLLLAVYLVVIVGEAALHPGAVAATLSGGLGFLIAVGGVLARRFNGEYKLTLRQSPAGLQLSSGLVQTTAETLPPGRIQALRMVEPLLWRPLGWCRVEAAVAGKSVRSEDRTEGNHRRALLPVGSYAQAHQVIALVVPDTVVVQTRPPRRTRGKAPLSYHHLSAGVGAHCVVTTSGRLRRVSHWVPLAKVQSIRRTQGPVQRRLRLATVHLDTAGPRMRTALRDRDEVEADAHVAHLPGLCTAARAHR